MIAGLIFYFCAFVLLIVLLVSIEDIADWLLARPWIPRVFRPVLRWVSEWNYKKGWILFGVWAILALGLPTVYEFPRWGIGNKQSTWVFSRHGWPDQKNGFRPVRQLPWYGMPHSFSWHDVILSQEIPVGPVRTSSVFVIEDAKLFKKYRITLELRGESWLDFLLDINNAQPSRSVFCLHDVSLVLNNFSCVLQQAQMPIDDVPEHAEVLCNRWLESQDIDAVRAVLVSVENVANPERNVWIQQ